MHQQTKADFDSIDLICFSHLRWGFVYQRPQHLMSRFSAHRRVFFVEEPTYDSAEPTLRLTICADSGVHVVVPALPSDHQPEQISNTLAKLLESLIDSQCINEYAAWFYTPMALAFAGHLRPVITIYDCMDELSLFRGAPPALLENEIRLFARADLVFTGGVSLYEEKRKRHAHVYPFPSSVDVPHFAKARTIDVDPVDQHGIAGPIIGYAGVIDERIDIELIAALAELRTDWQIVMLGPVVKISADALPRAVNIHYLGMKHYSDLPAYFSAWNVGMLPFALNDATRFISPTKTPEYLAAGLPVISTPIADVVRPYGESGLAEIASTAAEFSAALDLISSSGRDKPRAQADAFLSNISWDKTWNGMNDLILSAIAARPEELSSEPACSVTGVALETIDV